MSSAFIYDWPSSEPSGSRGGNYDEHVDTEEQNGNKFNQSSEGKSL